MARFVTELINVDLQDDCRYSRIYEPFVVEDIKALRDAGLQDRIEIPTCFVHDYESVPVVKGTSKRGGVVHDYLCRKNSVPVVTKTLAAAVYFEVMEASAAGKPDQEWYNRLDMWLRRWVKYGFVKVWPGYFHKHLVEATYEEMIGATDGGSQA